MRFLSTLIALMAIVSLVGVVISIYLWTRVHHTSDDIRQTQVISCQTNNDVRQANAELWGFVLDSSEASNPMTAKQKLQVEKLRDWITKLYEPRDCSQLNKKYTIPPPPPIIKR